MSRTISPENRRNMKTTVRPPYESAAGARGGLERKGQMTQRNLFDEDVIVRTPTVDDAIRANDFKNQVLRRKYESLRGKVRRNHPSTSWESAKEIGKTLSEKQELVLAYIRKFPSTDNELIGVFTESEGWSPNTPRPRRIELCEKGLVKDSGERRNKSIVWTAV